MTDHPHHLEPIRKLLYTHEQMADALGIGETQLNELVREGCPRIVMGRRCVRYEPGAVMAWLGEAKEERKVGATHLQHGASIGKIAT